MVVVLTRVLMGHNGLIHFLYFIAFGVLFLKIIICALFFKYFFNNYAKDELFDNVVRRLIAFYDF